MARRTHRLPVAPALLLVMGLVLGAAPAAADSPRATSLRVDGGDPALARALAEAQPGDRLVLAAGLYHGPLRLTQSVTLEGEPGAVIDGGGQGRTITVSAADVTLRHLTVRNSGISLFDMDAGIFIDKAGHRARIEANHLIDNLVGVYVWGPEAVQVRGNRIDGRLDLRVNERGNGVQLWNTPGTAVTGNDIRHGRDGIFTNTSHHNRFEGNRFRDLRYAVHYMYTNDSVVRGNLSLGNDIGFAIMYSRGLEVRDNLSDGDRERGLLLNAADESEITGNIVRHGGEKCVFIYNANKNRFRGNWFEGCEIGIHFTAGSERNAMSGNAFVNNRHQVMYVGTRSLDWSEAGHGNYWSDNPAFDLDGNGIADTAYRPNDLVDRVVWTHPSARLLLNSPGIQVIRWAQAQFPALHPGGVIDGAPLIRPPELAEPRFSDLEDVPE